MNGRATLRQRTAVTFPIPCSSSSDYTGALSRVRTRSRDSRSGFLSSLACDMLSDSFSFVFAVLIDSKQPGERAV
jgi:hypothetical protein